MSQVKTRSVIIEDKKAPLVRRVLEITCLTVTVVLTLSVLTIPIILHIIIRRGGEYDLLSVKLPENFTPYDNITCADDFHIYYNACLPRCDRWTQYSKDVTQILTVIRGFSAAMGLSFSMAIFIIAGIRYKIIFRFPTVFIIYTTITYAVTDILNLISSIDPTTLYCSSTDLWTTILHPTVFCSVSGVLVHYTSVMLTYWWSCLIGVTFYKLVFPFRALTMSRQKHFKYVHIVLVIIGVILPLPGVVLTLAHNKFEYNLTSLPATLCLLNNGDLAFYSTTFVNIIFTSIFICLFIFIIRIIHKHEGLFRPANNLVYMNSTERKRVLLFIIYLILYSINFIDSAVSSAHKNDFVEALKDYFLCEAPGYTPGNCDRNIFKPYTSPVLTALYNITNGLLPLGILIYIINWGAAKNVFCKLLQKKVASEAEIYGNGHIYTSSLREVVSKAEICVNSHIPTSSQKEVISKAEIYVSGHISTSFQKEKVVPKAEIC